MKPSRLTAAQLREHLLLEEASVARLVRGVRRAVLDVAPKASEAIKFGVLCYFHGEAWFGSIGGNICMIEIKDRTKREGGGRGVILSFIHGASLPDPGGLLNGKGSAKRFLPIPNAEFLRKRGVAALLAAARDREAWS